MVKRVRTIPHCPIFYGDPSHVSQLLTWLVILPELLDVRVCELRDREGGVYVIRGLSLAMRFSDGKRACFRVVAAPKPGRSSPLR